MADFCNQCAKYFGFKPGDMKNLSTKKDTTKKLYVAALCEECGPILVDHTGKCISHKRHKREK